jgi:type I restriction enzyme R subunit
VQHLPQRNLAVELLQKLLKGELKLRKQKNVVQARSFAEMLANAINSYHNRAINTQEVIEELIRIAKDLRDAAARGQRLGLNDDEMAFYDALGTNDSAVEAMGDQKLAVIAVELVRLVKANVSIDWTVKETVRAKLRTMVKRILRKYGYPPDLQDAATQTVLEQAEVLCAEWV